MAAALAVEEAQEAALPAKRGRGRPKGSTKEKGPPVFYKCRYGCNRAPMRGRDLRKHMGRVHGIFSSVVGEVVYTHHCGRRYTPKWKGLCCNKPGSTCKTLLEGSEDWRRHTVPEPVTEQEAADTFAYMDGEMKPSALVIVPAPGAAAGPAQNNNGPPPAAEEGEEEDAEGEEDDEVPPAKRRRV